MRADQPQDFIYPRKPARQHAAQRIKRAERGRPKAVALLAGIFQRLGLRRGDAAACEFGKAPDFPQHLLGAGVGGVDRLCHAAAKRPGEIEFDPGPDHRLMHDVGHPGLLHHAVIDTQISVDKHPVARDLHIVENDKGVLLVEPGRQGVIEQVGGRRHAVAAEEFEAGSRHRQTEA